MKTKICNKCHKRKPLLEFHKNKSKKDGCSYWCKECNIKTNKKWYQKHKKQIKKYKKEYRKKYKQEIKKYNKQYHQTHKKQRNKYEKERRTKDINYKLAGNLRTRIGNALKNNRKSQSTMFLIGCDIEYLKYHLQCQFKKGMTWDNWGKGKRNWNIDHIEPCARFNYTNLQPLWAEENLKKK